MATTTHGSLQASGRSVTRQNVIRWVGRVAVANAFTTLAAYDAVDAGRRGKGHSKQRRQDQPRELSSRAIETTSLLEGRVSVDLALAGNVLNPHAP